jgi:predicted nucleotide-binding protein
MEDAYGELKQKESENISPVLSNKIFIVHGHDSQLKTDVERFIHEIGLEPVVLHRQADKGNTVIEKFEENSDVGYAFILLTPDEIAMTKDQLAVDETDRVKESRARPNVIFEFGYFVGKLGRSKVCCLHKGDVEIPSDLAGLVYKKVDESIDAQAYAIIKELKSAGYDIRV